MANSQKMVKKADRLQKEKEIQFLENADDFDPEQYIKKKKVHL